MDEPTGALDSKNTATIMKIVQDIKSLGKTIIVVTHDQNVAEYCDRILIMDDGVITGSIYSKRNV